MKEFLEYIRLFKERYWFYFNESLPSENEIERLVNDIAIKAVDMTGWFIILSPIFILAGICSCVIVMFLNSF